MSLQTLTRDAWCEIQWVAALVCRDCREQARRSGAWGAGWMRFLVFYGPIGLGMLLNA